MAPILLNAAASVAGDLIDTISDRIAAASAKPAGGPSFDTALAQAQNSPAVQAAALASQQANLTNSLMTSPEVQAALTSLNPGQSAQMEISSSGNVSLRSANGSVKPIALSTGTRAAVTQLYSLRQPGVQPGQPAASLVLAVDPMNALAPLWSQLPARH